MTTLPGIIAILRGVEPGEVVEIGAALVESGIKAIEVPLNSPDAMVSIARLLEAFGDRALIGAGTVLTPAEVGALARMGARLVVSPNTNPDVIRATKDAGLISLPGAMTPTECFTAIEAGADGLKLFPGELVGPTGLKAMKAVLPRDMPLFAVGGVSADNMGAWHKAGAAGYGIGSGLFTPGLSPDELRARAARLVERFDGLLMDG